jgi:putative toxin-antitoxin system antitoxin component (TIGR02293 family)
MSALSNKGNSNIRVEISPAAQAIVAHALDTFGSEGKAWMWLERPNALLGGSAPIQILQADPANHELVEDELTRIDYGVFV